MKKKTTVVAIIIILICILLIGYALIIKKSNIGYAYKIWYNSYDNVVIADYESFNELIQTISLLDGSLDKYDENYFDKKNLAVKFVETSSGGDVVTYKSSFQFGEKINIYYNVDTSQGITNDMGMYMIVVECSKNVKEIL